MQFIKTNIRVIVATLVISIIVGAQAWVTYKILQRVSIHEQYIIKIVQVIQASQVPSP